MTERQPPVNSLMTLRFIVAALLIAVTSFMIVVYFIGPNQRPMDERMLQLLLYIAIIMLVTIVPIGFVARAIIYRNHRDEDGAVSPAGYGTGNIIFFACCEGPAFAA